MVGKKLTVDRLSRYKGPRRKKPPVRANNAATAQKIADEHELLEAIARDIDVRRAFLRGQGRPREPYVVYTDFDQTYLSTETDPRHLPKWEDLGEYLKLQLLFLIALEERGFAFTVNVRPDLEAKWIGGGKRPMDRVNREIAKALKVGGIDKLAFAYIVEGKTKSGTSRTKLHLHGIFFADDPSIATKFKVAMERSIASHPKGKVAAGFAPHSGPAIKIERAYEINAYKPTGRGRWFHYIAKNVMRWDTRLMGRRVFISREATQTAKALWALICMDAYER
jgi:hypothetical protein